MPNRKDNLLELSKEMRKVEAEVALNERKSSCDIKRDDVLQTLKEEVSEGKTTGAEEYEKGEEPQLEKQIKSDTCYV
ncbi:hypothetical protein RUM43_006363 [Polyplax serrata]|uniref:Uncharacterized protein n=1 Tax=Polyplax serrata TaxID=468196 RepID=A0AAN8NY45_POLSC